MSTPQPTHKDMQQATDIFFELDELTPMFDGRVRDHEIADYRTASVRRIAQALAARDAEWREKCAAFLDESGEPRKVLDECTAGNGVYKIGEMLCANELEKGETVVVLAAAEAARKDTTP